MNTPADRLASLTGLDAETVNIQILPYLQSIPTRPELQSHLQGLLGKGNTQDLFIKKYVDSRFPPPPPIAQPPTKKNGQGKSAASTPPVQQKQQPLDIQSLTSTFENKSGGGSVYLKNRDEVLFEGSGKKKGKGGKGGRSGGATPTPSGSRAVSGNASPAVLSRTASPAPPRTTSASPAPPAKKPEPPLNITLSPGSAAHLSYLNRILISLTSSPRHAQPTPCFCSLSPSSPHQHTAPVPPLPSLCPQCALILCSLTDPMAPCPSCNHAPLMERHLVGVAITKFSEEKESLIETERRRYKEQEKEKVESFPDLGPSGKGKAVEKPKGYAASAGGSGGIDDRIREGYERLQRKAEMEKEEKRRREEEESRPRTVLRLTKGGKAKVVTVTPKVSATPAGKNASKSAANTSKASDTVGEVDVPGATPVSDTLDDGVRIRNGETPLMAPPSFSTSNSKEAEEEKTKTGPGVYANPRRKLRYVAPRLLGVEA